MGEPLVWIDGRLVPAADATVSVFDHGLTVGDGVFETLRAVHGTPFATQRHLARLRQSASILGLQVPAGDDELRAAMAAVLASQGLAMARVRVTVTGGSSILGSDRSGSAPTVIVAAGPLADPAPSTAVAVVPWARNERSAVAGAKTTSYAENVVALAHAKARGATEALFANTQGVLCEGTGSNVFCVLGGRLLTPTLGSGCLAGVTRSLVLEVTGAVEQDVAMSDFADAEEVFLTSTGRYVQAVHRVDDRDLQPGPVTAAAADALRALVAKTSEP